MFLLRTGESLDIEIDSFNKSLKLLLSRHRINRYHGYPVTMMTNNLKHLFIENQFLVVHLRTMKVILVNHIRSH